jgi:hypothetical protein
MNYLLKVQEIVRTPLWLNKHDRVMVPLTESFSVSKTTGRLAVIADSSGVFTLKEINRVKVIQDVVGFPAIIFSITANIADR